MYIIVKKTERGPQFLFGNSSLVNDRNRARKFETRTEAQNHIDHWFYNSDNDYSIVPAEYKKVEVHGK